MHGLLWNANSPYMATLSCDNHSSAHLVKGFCGICVGPVLWVLSTEAWACTNLDLPRLPLAFQNWKALQCSAGCVHIASHRSRGVLAESGLTGQSWALPSLTCLT